MSQRSRIRHVLLALPLLAALSCAPFGALGSTSDAPAGDLSQAPVNSFTAEVTSPVSVQLRWPAAEGATKYLVEVQYEDLESFPLAEIGPDQTTYEDFPAPDGMNLTYRLRVITASGEADGGSVSVTTPVQEPNPLTVQAHDYEPVPWTPPAVNPLDPNFDPSSLYPPGFDPNNPDAFDPSSLMTIPSITEVIGPQGGSVSVTSPDEVTFTLTIPEGALDAEVPITLTPIESIDGLPLSGGLLGAVRIDPDGLLLEIPALLEINTPEGQEIPDGNELFGFAFNGEGQEFHLEPFAPEGFAAQYTSAGAGHLLQPGGVPLRAGPLAEIAARQLRSYGQAHGKQGEARSVVKDHRPSTNRDAAANRTAAAQGDDDLVPLVPPDEDVVPLPLPATMQANRIFSQAREARTWQQVMEVLDTFEFHVQQYGDQTKDINDKIWDQLLDQLKKLLEYNKEKCITSEDFNAQAFAQRMLHPPKRSFAEQMSNRFKKKYGDRILADIAAITKNCTYKLEIDSEIGATFPEEDATIRYVTPIRGEIPLRWVSVGGKPYLTGVGTLTYGKMQAFSSSANCTPIDYNHPNLAYALAVTVEPVFYPEGGLKDYSLSALIVVDAPGAKFDFTCTDKTGRTVRLSVPMLKGKSTWLGFYATAHEGDTGLEDWKILNAGNDLQPGEVVVAERTFDRQVFTPRGGWGNWSEDSKFRIKVTKLR